MSHYILFLTHCTKSISFRAGHANHDYRQLNFCVLISYIYCVYQTHTVFTYSDMKYKHKYEQALSIRPQWHRMSSDTFLKKYTKYWPPTCKLYVYLSPLWSTVKKTGSKCFKNKSDFSFLVKVVVGCLARQHHPLNMYVTVLEHATVKTQHRGEAATCCLMAPC